MLPARAVSGDDRPRNAMMKQTEATRYRKAERLSLIWDPGRRYFLRWNMPSMRWVTIKPPKMLTAARVTAIKPMTFAKLMPAGPAAISAPTMITLDTALVTLISGECSAGVTRQ